MIEVLYLSYDGMTDPLGQSQVLPYLKGLSKNGYRFHLISFEKEERFLKNKEHIQSICDASGIIWHPQAYTKKPPLLSTMKDVRKMQQVAFKLNTEFNFKIVHCRSYLSSLVGLKMKTKFGTKFIFDMRGFWADERVDGRLWNLKNPLFKQVYNYFKKKEIQFLEQSDKVISLTINGKNEMLTWKNTKINASKIAVIPCCVDLNLFEPNKIHASNQIQLREDLGITPTQFVLGYVGSIGTWYMLDEMLDYFCILLEQKENAVFLFITGDNPQYIRSKVLEKNIAPEKIIISSTIHQNVPLHISLFDASIFFIRPSYSKKSSSPTKQGEIMAMNIPVICNSGVGDTDYIIEHYQSGILIQQFNKEEYRKSIHSIDSLDKKVLNAGAHEYFSLEKGTDMYLKIYQEI